MYHVVILQTDTDNVECLKTCCGALAILAKDESNKVLIARDGTRLILAVMEGHATRPDLQVSRRATDQTCRDL